MVIINISQPRLQKSNVLMFKTDIRFPDRTICSELTIIISYQLWCGRINLAGKPAFASAHSVGFATS